MNFKYCITGGICLDIPFPHYLSIHLISRTLWSQIITAITWQIEQERMQGTCCIERTKGLFSHYWTSVNTWYKQKPYVKHTWNIRLSSNEPTLIKFMFKIFFRVVLYYAQHTISYVHKWEKTIDISYIRSCVLSFIINIPNQSTSIS